MIMPILQTRKLKHEDKRLAWVSTVSRAGILETEALGKNQRPCWKLLLPPGWNSNLNLPAGLSPQASTILPQSQQPPLAQA